MLLALAATIRFAELPVLHLFRTTGLITFFVWTSVLAMTLRAITGQKGFHFGGPPANVVVFGLYACGVVAFSIGLIWLIVGLLSALP